MSNSVKIAQLEVENVKRVKAVSLAPTPNGLTIIGGNNNQGKTSILDSIAWALGGEKFRPSNAQREGSVLPPHLKITLSNGLVVERSGKNSTLKVIDPQGGKSGQQLLNSFIEVLALDLPKFMNSTSKEKANTLLKIIGVGDVLYTLDTEEEKLYSDRRAVGAIADQKKKYAEGLPSFDGVPNQIVSAAELIRRQQDMLARNGENERKRRKKAQYDYEYKQAQLAYEEARKRLEQAERNAIEANTAAENLQDESTEQLEQDIANIDELNRKIRANLDRKKAIEEAAQYAQQYHTYTEQIEDIRAKRTALLSGAEMPLENLSVENGELVYNGVKWDGMSGSDQLKVSAAIVRKLNPKCGFVLLDKLEQMDTQTLSEFSAWLEREGLQAIATRVSTGDECSIIIEDGQVAPTQTQQPKQWTAGTF